MVLAGALEPNAQGVYLQEMYPSFGSARFDSSFLGKSLAGLGSLHFPKTSVYEKL